jgi:hypothetical protein
VKSLSNYAGTIRAQLATETNANNIGAFDQLDATISGLWTEIERKPNRLGIQTSLGMIMGMGAVGAVIWGTGYLLLLFIRGSPAGSLATVDGVRPILTFAAIISTVGFGGGLVFAALFANDANFETRFRTAREIFLVFSSVFATVVGFHFGIGAASPPAAPISIVRMHEMDGKLYLSIDGGTPPYTVEADFDGVKPKPVSSPSPVTLDLAGVAFDKAITKGQIKITDGGKGLLNIPLAGATLKKGEDLKIPASAAATGTVQK